MPWPFRKKAKDEPPRSAYFSSQTPLLSYWIYFMDRSLAEQAIERLRALGLSADLQKAAAGDKPWLTLAYRAVPELPDEVEHESQAVKSIATAFSGEYDGWEAGPLPEPELAERVKSWFEQGIGQP